MRSNPLSVSNDAIQEEWEEIQAAQRDAAHFRPLYDRYYEGIFRFIYRRTADEARSADLCSQVFLKALQKIKSYTFKGVPFSAWLYRIASNEISQYYRDTQKNRMVCIEDTKLDAVTEEIDTSFDQEQLKASMIEALRYLKPNELELIEMRFFEFRPFKEIASILDITESNAKVKTYRTLDKLKKIIASRPQT